MANEEGVGSTSTLRPPTKPPARQGLLTLRAGAHSASGDTANRTARWKIENAIELLDAPEEFFFDESTRELYLVYNGTGSPADQGWVVPQLKKLLVVQGKPGEPVRTIYSIQ